MAARRKHEDEKRADDPVAGTLAAEIRKALGRLVAYEGSVAAAARSIGLKRQRLARWLSRGIPRADLEGPALEQLLFVLYARFARLDRDQPARDARDKRMNKNRAAAEVLRTYSSKRERERLLSSIAGWVKRHREVAKFRGAKKSGVVIFAEELRVRVDLLRATLRDGTMSVKLFQAFREFERREDEQAGEDAIAMQKMDELMRRAAIEEVTVTRERRRRRVQEGGRTVTRNVWVDVEQAEPVIPKIANGSWDFSGEGTHGRRWGKKMGHYMLPRLHPSGRDGWALVQQIAKFALGVPGLSPPERFPVWNVYALASELGDELSEGSKKQYRDLDHEDDRRFVVNEAYSGGSRWGSRARERTISSLETDGKTGAVKRGFVQHIGQALDGTSVLYLHGAIAWNFRYRTDAEQKRREKIRQEKAELQKIVDRVRARVTQERAEKKAKKNKRVGRKKILAAVMASRNQRKKKR